MVVCNAPGGLGKRHGGVGCRRRWMASRGRRLGVCAGGADYTLLARDAPGRCRHRRRQHGANDEEAREALNAQ